MTTTIKMLFCQVIQKHPIWSQPLIRFFAQWEKLQVKIIGTFSIGQFTLLSMNILF